MIRFENVTEKTFPQVFEKMKAAFPYEERRDYLDQQECMNDERFKFLEIFDDAQAVGFTALWDLDGFLFIEHIAIDQDKRSGGYGSKTIELIKSTFNKPVILEAEAPKTAQQIKRIRFYDRLGFKINDFPYEQPSYHGDEGVPLKILSYPELLSDAEFENFINETRKSAYKKN